MRIAPILLLLAVVMPVCGQLTAEEWLEKGNALLGLGRYEEALQAYNESIRLDP